MGHWEQPLQRAQLAQQAERDDDRASTMKAGQSSKNLSPVKVEPLSVASKDAVGARRRSWRASSRTEQKAMPTGTRRSWRK